MDVIEGRGPSPKLLIPIIQAIFADQGSMVAAMVRGGPEFYGWGEDRQIAASTHDLLGLNVRATGNWKQKPPDIPPWPRPMTAKQRADKTSLKALFGQFRAAGAHVLPQS